jgi:2-dehydro-3-deoxygluconokinase
MLQRRWDVVALGEAMVEFNQTRAGEPHYQQGFGGDTSNAIIAAARAGAKTAYLSRVGADAFGQSLLGLWQQEQVDTYAVTQDASAATGIYFVSHGPSGHEFSYLRAHSAASRMNPDWLSGAPASCIAQAHWLHVSGISMAISSSACDTVLAAMALARAAGTQVSLDANLRLKLWPLARAQACIRQAIGLCDVFLPSYDDMVSLTGLTDAQPIVDWCHTQGARQVVLKLGAEGAIVSTSASTAVSPSVSPATSHAIKAESSTVAGHRVTAVDATGAGDCFSGNLLARLAAGDSLQAAAHYANAAAALTVQGFGAVASLPRAADVHASGWL